MSSISSVVDHNFISYPEFGTLVKNPPSESFRDTLYKAALLGVKILAFGASVALVGGFMCAVLVTGAILIYQLAKQVFCHYYANAYRVAFDPVENDINAPKLGAYSKADLILSNHVADIFKWKKELIKSAQSSIELSANFAGGRDFREVLDLIQERMKAFPNLRVHIILSKDLLIKTDLEYLDVLKKEHPVNFHYLITDRILVAEPGIGTEENHVKMLVVDGKYFATGGSGIHEKLTREEVPSNHVWEEQSLGAKVLDNASRDTDVVGCGEVARTMRNQFFNLYRIWECRTGGNEVESRYFPDNEGIASRCALFHEAKDLITNSSIKFIVGGPEHRKKNPISIEIADLISKAQTEVKIANLLFNPDKHIKNALEVCKSKKIPVVGHFNGTGGDSSFTHHVYAMPGRLNYHLLTKAFETEEDRLYHRKVVTLDRKYTLVGSYNLGTKSSQYDYEGMCVIDDLRVAAIMNTALDRDKERSIEVTSQNFGWWNWVAGKTVNFILESFAG
ncbi:MAG: phosphatidylserine/phosphatidylglycerophosphate/cardiolipin synthase family protein [Chlamydiales bacterium]|nr:phosphatidylserine/phosphatidylglycerophosphate/cardiolipin synthase family protein [Chlamydiales bacterium]